VVDAGFARGALGGGLMIAGDHPDIEAHGAQAAHGFGGFRLVFVRHFERAGHGAIDGDLNTGLAYNHLAAVDDRAHAETRAG